MPSSWDGIPRKNIMTEARHIQVLIADDHKMVRRGLRILLEQFPEIKVVGEAGDGLQAIELVSRLQPDVVLMDLIMPVMDGIEAIQRIIAILPAQRIIVLTAWSDSKYFVRVVQAGAQGYFVKNLDAEELIRAIGNVLQGRPAFDSRFVWEIARKATFEEIHSRLPGQLSEKEQAILRMLTLEMTDDEIARELVVTEVTVRTHNSRIIRKLRLENRVQADLYRLRSGLVHKSEIPQETFHQYERK